MINDNIYFTWRRGGVFNRESFQLPNEWYDRGAQEHRRYVKFAGDGMSASTKVDYTDHTPVFIVRWALSHERAPHVTVGAQSGGLEHEDFMMVMPSGRYNPLFLEKVRTQDDIANISLKTLGNGKGDIVTQEIVFGKCNLLQVTESISGRSIGIIGRYQEISYKATDIDQQTDNPAGNNQANSNSRTADDQVTEKAGG